MNTSKTAALALLVAAMVAIAPTGRAGEPVASPEALVQEVLSCLMKDAKAGKCMQTVLGRSVVPGFDDLASVAQQMDQLLTKWLDKDTVYAIHPTRTKQVGGIYEARAFLIEDSSGALMLFQVALIKRLGKWYVYSMNINSNSDVVEKEMEGE